MGTSVCAYHVRGIERERVIKALREVKSPRAFISPLKDEWVSVVDTDSDAFRLEELERRAKDLSRILKDDAIITGVYDDDQSFYVAFHEGRVVDRYGSEAGVFDWLGRKKFAGDPDGLARVYTWWHGAEQLAAILKKRSSPFLPAGKRSYRMESSRLRDMAKAFGIAEERAFTSFGDVSKPLPPFLKAAMESQPEGYAAQRLKDRASYVEFKGE